jgi:hypothetical protein
MAEEQIMLRTNAVVVTTVFGRIEMKRAMPLVGPWGNVSPSPCGSPLCVGHAPRAFWDSGPTVNESDSA